MIAIIDMGSQYTQLIARRIRELHTYSIILRHTITAEELTKYNPTAIILSGGPKSVYDTNAYAIDPAIFEMGLPILGICYGTQLIIKHFGGTITPSTSGEYGKTQLTIQDHTTKRHLNIFNNLTQTPFDVWMSHGDQAQTIGELIPLASTKDCQYAAIQHPELPIIGLQFHPEVKHTTYGYHMLRNFTHLAKPSKPWILSDYITDTIANIKETVSDKTVICGMSGGVDSSVVAAILGRAIGKQAYCVFVNNGLLRTGETKQVVTDFNTYSSGQLRYVDASDFFLNALRGVTDPQEKRKIIGAKFIDVFQKVAKEINADYLAQGTIYPDVIESGGEPDGPAAVIKFHHNVGGLPASLGLPLIEPLRYLFKDEVRQLGVKLNLPDYVLHRQPFPGPGMAVRILGEITTPRLSCVRHADSILQEEWRKHGCDAGQYFTVLLPIQTVGVMGDGRTYDNVIAIRAVETTDFMTAAVANLSYEFLTAVGTRIANEVVGVNRVVYDITSKPPATIEWE